MITVTYVTSSHPNSLDFEHYAMSDAIVEMFVANQVALHNLGQVVNCTIVNENALLAFRLAVAREDIHHENIRLVFSSKNGEEWCKFSKYGVILRSDTAAPAYPQSHGVDDILTKVLTAAMDRKKRDRECLGKTVKK